MKAPLTEEQVFHPQFLKDYGSDVIFNEGVNFKSKEFHAFMLSYYFDFLKGGFIEECDNAGIELPEEDETWEKIETAIYKAALVFFDKYPSSLEVIENYWGNRKKHLTEHGYTYEILIEDSLYCTSLELGTLLGTFCKAKAKSEGHSYPLHEKYTPDTYDFSNFEESFLNNIFQNHDLLVDFIKNTWFGRASLADHYKDATFIPQNDLWALRQIEWVLIDGKYKPDYQKANLNFMGITGKYKFNSGLYNFCDYLDDHTIRATIDWNSKRPKLSGLVGALLGMCVSLGTAYYAPHRFVQLTTSSSLTLAANVIGVTIVSSLAAVAIVEGFTMYSSKSAPERT